MQKLTEGVKTLHKSYGKETGGLGAKYPVFDRLPTGIFPLDVALGGGFPMGAVSIIYGAEGGGKTSLAIRLAVQFQKRYPKKKIAWIDIENQWDEKWARLHGLDTDQVYLFKPTTSEEAADIASEVAFSEDAGLLIADSIAALASFDQIEKDANKVVVAGAAKSSTTMMRKIGAGMAEHAKAGSSLTTIYINQVRNKIGFVMGNPEILPGPVYQNYQAFLKLRVSAKPILKEKISATPIYSDNKARIAKKKFEAIRQACEWQTILYPHAGHNPLDVNNSKYIENILEELGYLEKEGKGWLLYGEVFPTKIAAVTKATDAYDDTLTMVVEDLLLMYKDHV